MPKTILVIDDELGYREMFRHVLAERGYEVLQAESGKRALELLRERAVDLVFTDMKMPSMDGLDVVVALKREHPRVPIVLMTGYAMEDRVRQALSLKASGCLRKPFELEELMRTIEGALPA